MRVSESIEACACWSRLAASWWSLESAAPLELSVVRFDPVCAFALEDWLFALLMTSTLPVSLALSLREGLAVLSFLAVEAEVSPSKDQNQHFILVEAMRAAVC